MSDQETKGLISEQLAALFDGTELQEETKQKLDVIFEAAVMEKVEEEKNALIEQYDAVLEQAKQEIREEYEEKIDEYLTYVAQEWMAENRLAVEKGIRAEIAESFIEDLRAVFEAHNVEVPASKVDLVEELTGKYEEVESALNEQIEKNIKLAKFASSLQRQIIIAEMTEDLSDAQAERIKSLSESIDFENAEQFAEKVSILKEAFAKKSSPVKSADNTLVEEVAEVKEVLTEEKKEEKVFGGGNKEMSLIQSVLLGRQK